MYQYMDSCQKFEETKVPPKNLFYRKLNMKVINDKDQEYAQ